MNLAWKIVNDYLYNIENNIPISIFFSDKLIIFLGILPKLILVI